MSLFRKLLLSIVLGAAVLTPVSHTPEAHAHPVPSRAQYYAVYYRANPDSPWSFYYSFYNRADAERYAAWIQSTYRYDAYVYTVR